MPSEPSIKRTVAFLDGQNLYHAAREAFGYKYPNFDPTKLAQAVCDQKGWQLDQTRFYTGVAARDASAFWHHFWTARLAVMGTRGVHTYSRPLRYRNKTIKLPNGSTTTALVGQEKGIDVRIALDIVGCALDGACDVALVFSQDQDLSEVADEIRKIARQQGRWIKIACAFPVSPTSRNKRGINGTDWLRIDRATYDACIDPNDYRLRGPSGSR